MTSTTTAQTTQLYRMYIKATPEAIWEAITTPEFTARYFYGARISVTPDRYRALGPDDAIWGDDGVLEYDPPKKLVHEWRSRYDEELAAEDPSRVTWEIEPQEDGATCLLTVVHDRLEGAPKTAASVSGGWAYILSGLKTLLETGEPLAG
jgi:uncharacterized protein YndB with AHSA1/START domain